MSTLINEFLPIGLDRKRVGGLMAGRQLDGILLTSPENVFYVTGYTTLPTAGNPILYLLRNRFPFAAFIDASGATTLFCWLFSTFGVELGVDEVIGSTDYASAVEKLAAFLKQREGKRIGIESTCPYYVSQLLGSSSIVVADDVMVRARTIKSEAEIDHLARSLAAAEATMHDLYQVLRVGIGRVQLISEAKAHLFGHGATGIGHATISFGTANPELAIDEKLYAFSGKPPTELIDHYLRMVEVVDEVGAAITPGATYADVFRRGRDLLTEVAGNPPAWLTHVGHHIGLETEEEWIVDRDDIEIQPGMVINIELYSQASTGDYIGDEETFVVDSRGSTRISQLPREIQAL